MRKPAYWAITAVAFLVIGLPACAQLSDAQLVVNAYPQDLANAPEASTRFNAFVAADLNRNGQVLLVALYTNGTRAALTAVNRAGQIVARADNRFLKGDTGEIELLDLDADGTPEIITRLYSGHSAIPDTWIYAWRNNQFALISPTQHVHGLDVTLLSQIAPVDLDGTGRLAILAFPGVQRDENNSRVPNGDGIVYVLSSGQYTPTAQRFRFAQAFYRRAGGPTLITKHFAASPGSATLRVINGVQAGAPSADSAQIMLNGVSIVGPSSFKPTTHVITVPVQLTADNTLSVDLAGKPSAGIWVLIGAP